MTRALAPALFAAALALSAASVAHARDEAMFAVIGPARAQLEREWDASPQAREKAYCVVGWSRVQVDTSSILLVTHVRRAAEAWAYPDSVSFSCDGRPEVHTHPAFDCTGGPGNDSACVLAPPRTYCHPSHRDVLHLAATAAPFGVIACGPTDFVLYLPPGRQP